MGLMLRLGNLGVDASDYRDGIGHRILVEYME